MPVVLQADISDAQLQLYSQLIYGYTGILISADKKALLSNRLRRRLKATGIATYEEYYKLLKGRRLDSEEWDAFLQDITTHETYLFRDPGQWDWFRGDYLQSLQEQAKGGGRPKTLRVWSAACSAGDEPYTIAVCAIADLPQDWRVQILATDIGVETLNKARKATFNERSMRNVPEPLRQRFFTASGDTWKAGQQLSRCIEFRKHNLMDPLDESPFDIVFIKNVLIYFDTASKKQVMGHVHRLLAPGGTLVSGVSEGIADLLQGYERVKSWLHLKPAAR
ncbi:MAG: protein-glutamate O-methyltransferase CheR [Planctomycetales bacterium]|nr:protein-glutamate O-methyltransferase CheR [Planctomycetales bacterium]